MGRSRWSVAFFLFCVLCCCKPLGAAESPLAAIPVQTDFVARFKAPQIIFQKIDSLLRKAQSGPSPFQDNTDSEFDWGDFADFEFNFFGKAPLTGADKEHDWWMFGSLSFDEDPKFCFAIPAIDAKKLKAELANAIEEDEISIENADEFVFLVHEKWVLYGEAETIEQVRNCIAGKTDSIARRLDAEAKLLFNQGDAGVYVNVSEMLKTWGPFVAALPETVKAYLARLGINLNTTPGTKKFLEAIPGQLFAAIAQGISDVDGFTASLTLDEDEIRFEDYISVKPDTPTAAFLRANPASTMEPLADLPTSCALYFGFHGNQKAITAWVTEACKAAASDDPAGLSAAHAEVRRGLEALEYGTLAAAFPVFPVDQGILRMLSIAEVDDPQRARELGLKWMDLPPLTPKTPVVDQTKRTLGVEKFGQHPADVCVTPSGFAVEPFGGNLEKDLFGPDGHVTRTVYLKDRIVEATGGTRLEMAAAVRRAADASIGKAERADEPLFLQTRKKLGEKANVIVMVDVCSLYAAFLQMATKVVVDLGADAAPANDDGDPRDDAPQAVAIPNGLEQMNSYIESLKSSPSLVGISLTLEPQASRLKVVVPVATSQVWMTVLASVGMLGEVGGPDAAQMEDANDQMQEGEGEADTPEDPMATPEETPADPDKKPAVVPDKEIAEARKWTGRIREQRTLNPIGDAFVVVKISTTGDETTSETKMLREIPQMTDADGSYRFTITPLEAAQRRLYVELTVSSPDHLEFYGGYGYRLLLKDEKLGGRPFFEDIRLPPGRPIEGTVKTPDGNPAVGVKVIVCTSPNFQNRSAQVRFPETKTDAEGHFRLVIFRQARAIFWILPQDYAPQTQPVKQNQEGDLGTFTLNNGPRLSGKLLDTAGKPVAGAYVEAEFVPQAPREEGKMPMIPSHVADQTHRATVTADDGSFEFRPLRPGKYRILPTETGWDPSTRVGAIDPPRRPLPAVFLSTEVILKRGEKPPALEIRAIPHVVIEVQSKNGKGEKRGGPDMYLFGSLNGTDWQASCLPTPGGAYRILAPKGLEGGSLSVITNEHSVVRFRPKKDAPLQGESLSLEKLSRSMKGIELVCYEAPILDITLTNQKGERVKDIKPKVAYTDPEATRALSGRDVSLQEQGDGKYRTFRLVPDLEVDILVEAEGFKTASRKLALPEAKTEEVKFVLEPE